MSKAGLIILSLGIALLGLVVSPAVSEAGGNVSIGFHETFVGPAYGPGFRVSDVSLSLIFNQGHWYRPFGGKWYGSRGYGRPWGYIAPPRVLFIVPPAHHHRGPVGHGFSYGTFRKHWGRW
jgi:hypothetical protein